MDILQELRAGGNNRKTIRFPGTDKPVDLKILTIAEEQEAEFAAENHFRVAKIDIAFHNADQFALEITVRKLFIALRVVGGNKQIASDITAFKAGLTPFERDYLVDEFNALCDQVNPSPRTMGIEEFDSLIERVKKNAKETISSISSFATLKRLSLYLANLLLTSPTANGSTSSE